jgi:anti-sigma B factor antagonist
MNLSTRDSNDIKILDIEGILDTQTAPDGEQFLNNLLDEGATKILVNLKKLEYVSSAGLRVFLATAKKLKVSSGKLHLCHLNETVQEIFDISGFSTILNVSATEADALENW